MKKCPKYSSGGAIPPTNPVVAKKLTPKQWNEQNEAAGYKRVNTPFPTVYGVYYDPNKMYQTVDDKTMTVKDLPYITYDHPQIPKPAVNPNHQAMQFTPGYNYNPNSGQYFNPTTGKQIDPIIQQYKKGGEVKGYANGGTAGFNERFNSVNTVTQPSYYGNANQNQQKNKISPQAYQIAGSAALGYGTNQYNNAVPNQNPNDKATKQGIDTAIQSTPATMGASGWYGLAKGASDFGRSKLSRDQYGNPNTNFSRAADDLLAPQHENAMDAYKTQGAGGVLKEFFTPAAALRAGADINGEAGKTTGFWGAINKFSGNTAKMQKQVDDTNASLQADYDTKMADYTNKRDQNNAAFSNYSNDLINQRNAGITDTKDQFINPNANLTKPALQQNTLADMQNASENNKGVAGFFHRTDNQFNKLTGGNNFASNAYSGADNGINNFGNSLNNLGKKYFSDGGEVKGKGTGTSDSIKATVKPGSFIVPKVNAEKAKAIKKVVMGEAGEKEANLDQDGGVDVMLSNGEYQFTPEEASELEAAGIDLKSLAPHANNAISKMKKK